MSNRFRRCPFTFARRIPIGAVYHFDSFTPKLAFTLSSFECIMTNKKSGLRRKQEKRGVLHDRLKRYPKTDALLITHLLYFYRRIFNASRHHHE